MTNTVNQYNDAQLARIITEYVHGSDHADLAVYRKDFETKFDVSRWIIDMRSRCNLAGLHNKRILEVGCGFGWDAVGVSLIGNNSIVATDILPSMIDGTQQCLDAMAKNGNPLSVTALQGDICNLDLPDESFDAIYSSEAIEHVHDLSAMFARCWKLLKPGGTMFIANDSNQYNSEFRNATFEMWKERDESWPHAKWLASEIRPVEHANAEPYAAMRERIILDAAPDLGKAHPLVAATAGMVRKTIIEAVAEYRKSERLPERPTYSWCRNPETGEYAERLLDPFELRQMLRATGFANVRLRHGFNRFPHRLLNGLSFKPLNAFLFDQRGLFFLLATKP